MAKLPRIQVDYVPDGSLDGTAPWVDTSVSEDGLVSYWRVASTYSTNEMRIALPVSVSSEGTSEGELIGNSLEIIRLAAPITYRTVRILGERWGEWPTLPKPIDYTDKKTDIKATILRRTVIPRSPSRGSQGEGKYTVDAEFIYALSKTPKLTDPLLVGSNLWEDLSAHYFDPAYKDKQVM